MRRTVAAAVAGALTACPGDRPGVCDPTWCTGCCSAAGFCEPGTADALCGQGGSTCRDCAAQGSGCVAGACATAASPDAGPDGGSTDAGPDGGDAADGGSCRGAPGDRTASVFFGGRLRYYHVHAPPSYDCRRPTAVVFNFHGYGSNATQQAALSRMIAKSDATGFLAVHPEGYGLAPSWNGGACCGQAAQLNLDDVGLVRTLLDRVAGDYQVDPRRVYSTGFSNGAFLTHRLACEASDRFAAFGPVAGVIGVASCNPARSIPLLHFHGTADTLAPYDGGGLLNFKSVEATMQEWAQRNRCAATRTVVLQQGDSTCAAWEGCPAGVSLELCVVDGGGHTWPGGLPTGSGKTTQDLSATDRMWDFFDRHRLP